MDSNEDEGVEDFSEEELRLPEGYDDEGSSAISDQDYLRADEVVKDDASAAENKVIWEAHMNKAPSLNRIDLLMPRSSGSIVKIQWIRQHLIQQPLLIQLLKLNTN